MLRTAQLFCQELIYLYTGSPQNLLYFSLPQLSPIQPSDNVFLRQFQDSCLIKAEIARKYHRVASIFVIFLVAVTKDPTRESLKEERFSLASISGNTVYSGREEPLKDQVPSLAAGGCLFESW